MKTSQHLMKKKYFLLTILLIIWSSTFFLMGYNKVSNQGPFSRHAYRQSDSYSFSLFYYYENNHLLEPSILFVGENEHGKTVSEFPILYFLTAKIWKITGISPFVPRMLNLLILFIGLFYLYRLAFELLKDHLWAFIVSLSLFSSPLLGFYGFNFIPNVPALGIALIATFYFYRYYITGKTKWLIIATALFSFAALLKISSLFLFLAANAVLFFHNILNLNKKIRPLLYQLTSIVILFLVVFSWYLFTQNYNSHNLEGIFNQSIIPIWSLNPERISEICSKAFTNTIIYFYNPQALMGLVLGLLISILFWRKANKMLLSVSLILIVGVVFFVILFFDGMDAHEYFLIDATVIIPAIILTFFATLKNTAPLLFQSRLFKIFACVIMAFIVDYNVVVTRAHFNPHDRMVEKNIPLPKRVKDYWDWVYWDWENNRKKYEGIVPYLRNLGINFDDFVISIPDETPNLTLTLLQQRGFTDYHYTNNYQGVKRTQRKIELGAKYMIVLGEDNLLREDVAPYTQNLIGEYNEIKIFKLPGMK